MLAVLSALRHENYGPGLLVKLDRHGISMDPGALYPMLRRLEAQGLLTSEHRYEDARTKRYYRCSEAGLRLCEELLGELATMVANLFNIRDDGS